MSKAKISLENIKAGYGTKIILDDVSFSVLPGHILTLMGPNGSGKSTLIKTIATQIEKLGGTIFLGGEDLFSISKKEMAKQMSVMLTERPDPEYMSCLDVVEMGRLPYTGTFGFLSKEDKKIVKEAMELVHITELADVPYRNISDGQRQRVMLARAIAQEPTVLIMDEPTTFLDIRYKIDLLTILKNLVHKKQIAVILSLHELELAGKISDEVLCVSHGKVGAYGTVEEIFSGNYIKNLYEIENGKYIESYGSIELTPVNGKPRVFVICGGGSGIHEFHKLWREDMPFACGILMENDMEYPIAEVLASRVVSAPAFEMSGDEALEQAKQLIDECEQVVCRLTEFNGFNRANKELLEYAKLKGKLK